MKDREGPITVTVHPEKSQGGNEKLSSQNRNVRFFPK